MLKVFNNGMLGSNVYLYGDDKECVMIDAGVEAHQIHQYLKDNKLKLKYIILTHCHIDHILHANEIAIRTGAKVIVHKLDAESLTETSINMSQVVSGAEYKISHDMTVNNGDVIEFADKYLKVLHTPGHTRGGICLYNDELIFTGDTLFAGSCGRTDFPGGSAYQLKESIDKIFKLLPDSINVYSGHGERTTVGYEKEFNPYEVYLR